MKDVFYQNDTGSTLQLTCKDVDANVIDLTGCTVKLLYYLGNTTLRQKDMTVKDAINGVVEYKFASGDLDAEGTMLYRAQITYSDGSVLTEVSPGQVQVQKAWA